MFLVFCLDDERACEILSEPEGEGRDFTPGYLKGKDSAGNTATSAGSVGEALSFEPGALARLDKKVWVGNSQTLRAHMGDNQLCVALENHPQDGRLKICEDGVFPTVTQRFGSGGGNTHYVLAERKQCAAVTEDVVGTVTATDYKGVAVYFEPQIMKLREGKPGGGKGPLIQNNISATLSCSNEQTLFAPDSKNQVGTAIAIQGNVVGRKNENGPGGIGFREDKAYTVNTVDNGGAVCYQETVGALCASDFKGIRNQDVGEDKAVVETFGNNGYGKWNGEPAALKASGGDFPGGENMVVENQYAVRRLTPLECLRLQGLPDGHLDNIHISEPTAEQIEYWRSAWAELGKTKTEKQIRKWLSDPYGDGHAYRAIGNSLAVPCALWVLHGIVELHDKHNTDKGFTNIG
jgi:DNA (cytosine-5)-methyltransferase 1